MKLLQNVLKPRDSNWTHRSSEDLNKLMSFLLFPKQLLDAEELSTFTDDNMLYTEELYNC